MSSDYVQELTSIYEKYEEKKTQVKALQDEVKDLKNLMIEIMQDKGVNSVVVAGIEEDAVELKIEVVERENLNIKMIAENLGIKTNELNKIPQWVQYTKEGKITPEMLEEAKFVEEREQFSAKPYKDEM